MRGVGGLLGRSPKSRGLKDSLRGQLGQHMGGKPANLMVRASRSEVADTLTPVTVYITHAAGREATFSWANVGGDGSILAANPSAPTTTFNGGIEGQTVSAVLRCAVTQAGQTAAADVAVSVTTPAGPLFVSLSSGSSTESSTDSTYAVLSFAAGASNGTEPFGYSWSYGQFSGPSASISASSPNAPSCDFVITAGAAPATTVHGVECFMGDSVGRQGQTGIAMITIHWTG